MTEKQVSLDGRRLMIAIPAYDGKLNIDSSFALATLATEAGRYGMKLQLSHISNCSIITRARNMLVQKFLQSDCTDLLFVDADLKFRAADVLRLAAVSEGKDVVAGCYPRRGGELQYFTDLYQNERGGVEFHDGLLRVKRVGTGFMLVRRHVLEALVAMHPEWAYKVDTDNTTQYSIFDFASTPQGYVGEDYLFCDRARAAGFKIFVDPHINLGHIGQQEFTGDFFESVVQPLIEESKEITHG